MAGELAGKSGWRREGRGWRRRMRCSQRRGSRQRECHVRETRIARRRYLGLKLKERGVKDGIGEVGKGTIHDIQVYKQYMVIHGTIYDTYRTRHKRYIMIIYNVC